MHYLKNLKMGNLNSTTEEVKQNTDATFSLKNLAAVNQSLAKIFTWQENPWILANNNDEDVRLHIGCGDKIIPNFINIDFLPIKAEVLKWNLLDMWPSALEQKVDMAFCEDVVEHFFYNEQVYILCSMNLALKPNGVFRVLMPNLDNLVNYSHNFSLNSNDWYSENYGIKSGVDVLNQGMRFGGHRWLHNEESFELMSEICGFKRFATTCRESTVKEMNNLNIRDEKNSLSFASDLVKHKSINRLLVYPNQVNNAKLIEQVTTDSSLYKSTNKDPQVTYKLPSRFAAKNIILINFRGANLSEFNEHNYAKAYLQATEKKSIFLDSSLRSSYCCNFISNSEILTKCKPDDEINVLRFDPTDKANEYFTVGSLEIFFTSTSAD